MQNTEFNPKEKRNQFIESSVFFISGLNHFALGIFLDIEKIEAVLILLGICFLGAAVLNHIDSRKNMYSNFFTITSVVLFFLLNVFDCVCVSVLFPVLFWIWPFVLVFETVIVALIVKKWDFSK